MNTRQGYVPEPEARTDRFGRSAYDALSNYVSNIETANVGAIDYILTSGVGPAGILTSRTGGRFRVSGAVSGTATAADQITATLEVSINGGGFTAIATEILQASAVPGARFAATFDVLTAAIAIGGTIAARVRALNVTGNANTVDATQATISIQELPG